MTLSTLRLSNAALIVVEHERRLDVVGERRHLLLVEEVLEGAKTRSQEAESGAMAKTMRARRQRPKAGTRVVRVAEYLSTQC